MVLSWDPIPCLKNSQTMRWKSEHILKTAPNTHNLQLSEHSQAHTLNRAEPELMTLAEG